MFQRLAPETVYSIAHHSGRRYGKTEDAQDELTCVAALALCEKAAKIDRARDPKAFAYRVAQRACLKAIHRQPPPAVTLEESSGPADESLDPQTWVPDRLDAQAILRRATPAGLRAVVKKVQGQRLTGAERTAIHRLRAAA